MAKIKITENELKQVIRESVSEVLNEDQAARFKRRYNEYQDALKNYNSNYSKEWGDLSPEEQKAWQDKYNLTGSTSPEMAYNRQRASAKTRVNQTLNRRGVGAVMQKNMDSEIAELQKQVDAAKNEKANLTAKIENLNTTNKNLETKNAQLEKLIAQYKPAYEKQMADISKRGETLKRAGMQNFVAQNSNNGLAGQRPTQIPRQPNVQLKPGVYAA